VFRNDLQAVGYAANVTPVFKRFSAFIAFPTSNYTSANEPDLILNIEHNIADFKKKC
jgi:hypothetical protein